MRVEFKREVVSEGRNGVSKQWGLSINDCGARVIEINPVNSRCQQTRCMIQVPLESLDEFVEALRETADLITKKELEHERS